MESVREAKLRRTPPTFDEIRARAYEIFLARAGRPGSPETDWLQAEEELIREASAPMAADAAPVSPPALSRRATSRSAPARAGADGVATAGRSRSKPAR
jgi:hypothetical protein